MLISPHESSPLARIDLSDFTVPLPGARPVPLALARREWGTLIHFHPSLHMLQTKHYPVLDGDRIEWTQDRFGFGLIYLGLIHPVRAIKADDQPTVMRVRAQYRFLLEEARHSAQNPLLIDGLADEYERLHRFTRAWQSERIRPKLPYPGGEAWPDHTIAASIMEQPLACWVWKGKHSRGVPTINMGGLTNVPVYRVLWPHVFPNILLGDRRPPRVSHCISPSCVNPIHFGLYEPGFKMRPFADDRTRPGLPGQYISPVRRWGPQNWDGHELRCYRLLPDGTECQGALGDAAQDDYLTKERTGQVLKGIGWCNQCYKRSQGRRPTVARKQPTPTQQAYAPTSGELDWIRRMNETLGPGLNEYDSTQD